LKETNKTNIAAYVGAQRHLRGDLRGAKTLTQMADELGTTKSTVRRWLRRDHWELWMENWASADELWEAMTAKRRSEGNSISPKSITWILPDPGYPGHADLYGTAHNGRRYPLFRNASNHGGTPMRQASCTEMIRCALRDQYDAVLTEPLPRRWVDLINSLDQQERQARQLDEDHAIETSPEIECGAAPFLDFVPKL
jgi:hypothetical protein